MSEEANDLTPDSPKGIPCRACGCCHHETLDTRKHPRFIRRRRQCRNCGNQFTTSERLQFDSPQEGAA